MTKSLMGNSLWQLVEQSDAMSKFVLLTLLVMSIVCWAIFFYKIILLNIKKRQIKKANAALSNVATMEQLLSAASSVSDTLPGYFLSKNLMFLKSVLSSNADGSSTLSVYQVDLVQHHADVVFDDIVYHEESYLPFISTSAAVSPLLGLFGTVWGLVHAFVGISEQQSADIAAVAPGIAEALITTLAGLMVAIPALIMFNFLYIQVQGLEQQLLVVSNTFNSVVRTLRRD